MHTSKQPATLTRSNWSNLTCQNPLFSIILTTSNNPGLLRLNLENLVQILAGTESNYEVIIADDSNLEKFTANTQQYEALFDWLTQLDFPFHFIYSAMFDHEGKKDYGLASARNQGICNARGKVLLFLDHRVSPRNRESIDSLIKPHLYSSKKIWAYGAKLSKGLEYVPENYPFVENYSSITKHAIVRAGMFCERVNEYGGMTLELTLRFAKQGFTFLYIKDSISTVLAASPDRAEKDAISQLTAAFVKKIYFD